MTSVNDLEILREDPPVSNMGRRGPATRYVETAELLKDHPGEWYRIASGQRFPEIGVRIRKGRILSFQPKGSFEATSRKIDGLWSTWARYVGEE